LRALLYLQQPDAISCGQCAADELFFTLQRHGLLSQAPDEEQAAHEPLVPDARQAGYELQAPDEWQAGYELPPDEEQAVHDLQAPDEEQVVHEL
jgi:hypothetical protein